MAKLLVSTLVLSATAYTLFIAATVWFSFAFFSSDANGVEMSRTVGFGLFALSPVPVCIYCFKRVKALLNGEHPKV